MLERNRQRLPTPIQRPGYEIFIGLLAVLSIVNLVIIYVPGFPEEWRQIAFFMNVPLTVAFLFDFFRHLALTHPRRQYFITERGWIDLLGSLPTIFPILRLFRFARVWRLLRTYTPRQIYRTLIRDRAATALQLVLFLVLVTVEFGGMIVLTFEQDTPGANITTGGDAIWWAFVSITTVGYGDKYPITTGGRMTAVIMLWMGVALIGVLSAYLANLFLRPSAADAPDESHAADGVDLLTVPDPAPEPQWDDAGAGRDGRRSRGAAGVPCGLPSRGCRTRTAAGPPT